MKFSIKDFHPWETADLVTFTGEILNGKYHFLWSNKSVHHKKYFSEI